MPPCSPRCPLAMQGPRIQVVRKSCDPSTQSLRRSQEHTCDAPQQTRSQPTAHQDQHQEDCRPSRQPRRHAPKSLQDQVDHKHCLPSTWQCRRQAQHTCGSCRRIQTQRYDPLPDPPQEERPPCRSAGYRALPCPQAQAARTGCRPNTWSRHPIAQHTRGCAQSQLKQPCVRSQDPQAAKSRPWSGPTCRDHLHPRCQAVLQSCDPST